jgi:hypothetical protein
LSAFPSNVRDLNLLDKRKMYARTGSFPLPRPAGGLVRRIDASEHPEISFRQLEQPRRCRLLVQLGLLLTKRDPTHIEHAAGWKVAAAATTPREPFLASPILIGNARHLTPPKIWDTPVTLDHWAQRLRHELRTGARAEELPLRNSSRPCENALPSETRPQPAVQT